MESDKLHLQTGQDTLKAFAERLKNKHLAALQNQGQQVFRKLSIRYKGEPETYYSYCSTHRLHNYGKHRLVIKPSPG